MSFRLRKLYFDIIQASDDLLRFTDGKSYEDFADDRVLQAAVERWFEIIGEAVNRISHEFPEDVEEIPNFRRIIGMRNILAHGYDAVDDRVLWDTLQNEVAPLVATISQRLEDIG
jgi:uncharacterized protein with HEPN domain